MEGNIYHMVLKFKKMRTTEEQHYLDKMEEDGWMNGITVCS